MDDVNGASPPDGVQIKIGVHDGRVLVIFPQPIANLAFDKLSAYEFASTIMAVADQLGGPIDVSNN